MCLALLILSVAGCSDSSDERLAAFAQQSMAEQRMQNDRIADQSQAVVAESHQLAEAAKELVKSDAEARRELIAAQSEMTSQLNKQQSVIYSGHDQLERDRRNIASQRHRDPIIATVIQNLGLTLACVLPLVVAVFVIRQMHLQEPDHAAVAEMLVLEMTSDEPRLLPGPMTRRPALGHDDEETNHALFSGDSTDDVEQPI
ncbi:hypothetical protein Poly21_56300 [Allorhodopirellula heiligendammensis]|uniref:Uncharacterized protein n=2 Tax=Allorhodopirellula heiligendammensis TaxID=2714739 RepID=A0A5C6B352_9BACT|nr:hypothetical protein Poly21_56300 [Allorhodopirellula heiligendammensis]